MDQGYCVIWNVLSLFKYTEEQSQLQAFRKVTRGGEYNDQTLENFLNQRGLMARFFRPLLRMVDRSWKMYPIGVLFGLGFDTATEVGLLGIAAVEAGSSLPVFYILLFPLLFMAGMMLLDTTDGILMLGAYGWAFLKPVRKLYYNLNITLVSVLVALIVGTIEILTLVTPALGLTGGFWDFLGNLNFGVLGGAIVGLFVLSWAVSAIVYKVKGYDKLDRDKGDGPAQHGSSADHQLESESTAGVAVAE